MFSPVTEMLRGLRAFPRGVRWLREHPRYFVLLSIPGIVGFAAMIAGISLFATYDQVILERLLFAKPDAWLWLAVYYLCKVLLYLAAVVLTFVASLLITSIVASPLYDLVSVAVERDVAGLEPPPQSWGEMLRVVWVEAKKVALILFVSVVLLLIPGVNLVATLVTAFLVGWDFFDYPLSRRGWTLKERFDLARREGFAVFGLGLWLVIPFISFLLMPLAVVGGTLLNLEALKKRQLLAQAPRSR